MKQEHVWVLLKSKTLKGTLRINKQCKVCRIHYSKNAAKGKCLGISNWVDVKRYWEHEDL